MNSVGLAALKYHSGSRVSCNKRTVRSQIGIARDRRVRLDPVRVVTWESQLLLAPEVVSRNLFLASAIEFLNTNTANELFCQLIRPRPIAGQVGFCLLEKAQNRFPVRFGKTLERVIIIVVGILAVQDFPQPAIEVV